MKKLLHKMRRKKSAEPVSSRITTETIAEHRERILAGGRRFKYPVQYARHKLVFNAIIITAVTLFALVGVGYWQLYIVQNTSDFMYRVTRVVPVPAASIDGQSVAYSDYLMKYRSSIHYLETKERVNLSSEDGKRQSDFVKQQAMEDALADAYAIKLAKQNKITVTAPELEVFLKQQRNSPDGEVSEQTYNAVILDYYNWSPQEYRRAMETKLLRQKVSYAVDTDAASISGNVAKVITAGNADIKNVVETINKSTKVPVVYGSPGLVPKTNQDGGLAAAAAKLKVGEVSSVIKSTTGDGYYYIKLIDANDTQVSYEFVLVPLMKFAQNLADVIYGDRVDTYISLPEPTAAPATNLVPATNIAPAVN